MYRPAHFAEDRPEVLVAAMRSIQLGAFITPTDHGLEITHIPTVIHHDEKQGAIVIEAHLSRANPHWKGLSDQETVVLFQGPHSYVSPSWFPSKKKHEKVVPTWNYIAIHAHGHLELQQDADWLSRHLDELTRQNEAQFAEPWDVSDAPEKFVNALTRGIVGLRLVVERIEGVWKINQNMAAADRDGAAQGLAVHSAMGAQLADALKGQSGS